MLVKIARRDLISACYSAITPVNAAIMILFSLLVVTLFSFISTTHAAWNFVAAFVLSYPCFFDAPLSTASNDSIAASCLVKYVTRLAQPFWIVGRLFHSIITTKLKRPRPTPGSSDVASCPRQK
jgi:hypothetical protein